MTNSVLAHLHTTDKSSVHERAGTGAREKARHVHERFGGSCLVHTRDHVVCITDGLMYARRCVLEKERTIT
jgi:hypothetical protein